MATFHKLTVTDVRKTIKDAVVVTLKPDAPEAFDFIQGQYLTFRQDFDGTEVRRSYSICVARGAEELQVGIKRVDGGAFSSWANTHLQAGDTLEAMPPMGKFHTPITPRQGKSYLGFAGGSGITPLLSIIRTVLREEPESRFTLVYANRSVNTIMFREELEDLKNSHMGRLSIVHILEHDSQDIDLFTGRVTEEKCAALFERWIDVDHVDMAFICGPEPMMLGIASALRTAGLRDEQIKYELFVSAQPGRLKQAARSDAQDAEQATYDLSIRLDGASRQLTASKDTSVLEAALEASLDAPHACKAGVCSTCMCRLVEGEVEMAANHALEDYEVEQGFILACQSYPVTDKVVVDFDERH